MSVVEEVCMLVDALTTDEERVRALLLISTGKASSASSLDSPFVHLIRFAETGGPLPYWRDGLNEQKSRPQWEKTLGVCKGAVIKAIVTVAGEKSQMDVLWGANDPNGGWFVEKMLTWIREYPASKEARNDEERDDLVICGTLCLGNLARTGVFTDKASFPFHPQSHQAVHHRIQMCDSSRGAHLDSASTRVSSRTINGYQTEARCPRPAEESGPDSKESENAGRSWYDQGHLPVQSIGTRWGYR